MTSGGNKGSEESPSKLEERGSAKICMGVGSGCSDGEGGTHCDKSPREGPTPLGSRSELLGWLLVEKFQVTK